jgi:multidrug resistance efflux pump
MDPLPPIPTPPAERWREFRIQALPVITFLFVLACVVLMWRTYVLPTNIIGEVEINRAFLISAVPGTIKEIKVERFKHVRAGDELVVISTMDTETVQASLRAVQADLTLLRARMQLDIERNQHSYEMARLEFLKERTDLAFEKVNAHYYELEAQRLLNLLTNTAGISTNSGFQVALASRAEYELAQRLAASAHTNILTKEAYLAEKEKTLPRLAPATKADDAILEAIEAQAAALRATSGTVTLKAPIDGVISSISFFAGQKVVENSPILTISSTNASRIVGYVRRPFTEVPKPGDIVQIRRHSFKREVAESTIIDVARQLEPISPNLVPPSNATAANGTQVVELGLPFVVTLPPDMNLLPGEPVDLIIKKR